MKSTNYPTSPWLLSEMVVEIIAKVLSCQKYFGDLKLAHNYFYKMKIDNKNIFEILMQIFKKSTLVQDFMQNGFDFVKSNK